MITALAIAAGGAMGSLMRYGAGLASTRMFGPDFPYATMAVNILGSCIMGALIAAFAIKDPVNPTLKLFLTTGVLGGFTTFSAFSIETIMLYERKAALGIAYAAASVTLSLAACWAGMRLIRILTP